MVSGDGKLSVFTVEKLNFLSSGHRQATSCFLEHLLEPCDKAQACPSQGSGLDSQMFSQWNSIYFNINCVCMVFQCISH